jgi:threonine dehydrogenase-like Zn-dependent dehydrogenase
LQKAFEDNVNTIPDADNKIKVSTKFKEHSTLKMRAAEWHGKENIKIVERPAPTITDDRDCIVRITSTTVCGSDLHMYFNQLPGSSVAMQVGDIMGHESVGIVTDVGPMVKNVTIGDRVVISAPISCGECSYCKAEQYSCCDATNPSNLQQYLYGHRTTGIFGYSHFCGGYAGVQAEYARVPFADVNTLKITNDKLRDEQILPLADILCTGYHGNELANVQEGKTVCIWGCGPVGIMAQYIALHRKAKMVIGIDNHPERLELARKLGSLTINFDDVNVTEEIRKLIPDGPDCCIDCVGYRFPKSWNQWLQQKLKVATDAIDVVRECIFVCRKAGHIGLIGDYFDVANSFPIGAFMEKGLTMSGGQLYCQKYWKHLLDLIEKGELDPSFIFSHTMKFEEIDKAYDMFGHVKDGVIKVFLKTQFGVEHELGKQAHIEHRDVKQTESTQAENQQTQSGQTENQQKHSTRSESKKT